MHNASLESSPRLQRTLEALLAGERTTLEIAIEAQVCAVNSCIAELRECGFKISCRQSGGRGERVWLYRLELGDEATAEKVAKFRQLELEA